MGRVHINNDSLGQKKTKKKKHKTKQNKTKQTKRKQNKLYAVRSNNGLKTFMGQRQQST